MPTSDLMKQGVNVHPIAKPVTSSGEPALPPAPGTSPEVPVVSTSPVSAVPETALPLREKVYNEADRIFTNIQHTKYQHQSCIDETTGTYETDCSGFVSYVLGRVAKRHLALIPKETDWPDPRAYMYHRFFSALSEAPGAWQRLERLADARPGDIIAWELPGELRKDHDTGHVFIVAETPSLVQALPEAQPGDQPDGQLMAVRAFDSAELAHYDDSRKHSDGTRETGVGEGTFHIRVDADGKPVAFQFGPGDNFHTDPITIGRALPLKASDSSAAAPPSAGAEKPANMS